MSIMYVYITASTEWTNRNKKLYQRILGVLSDWGFQNSNDYVNSIINNTPNPDIDKKDFHIITRKRIKKAGLLLADISDPSVTIGTLIEYAISNNIPVLSICNKNNKKDLPSIIRHYDSSLFTLKIYNKKNIEDVLRKYLETFKRGKVKFNAFISPSLDSYMKWYSRRYHISKSDFVRDMILEKMEKDKEFSKTLPNQENKQL